MCSRQITCSNCNEKDGNSGYIPSILLRKYFPVVFELHSDEMLEGLFMIVGFKKNIK